MEDAGLNRREFLKSSGKIVLGGAAFTFGTFGCATKSIKEILATYTELTKEWDPVFGPIVPHGKFYFGRHDFKGHLSGTEYGRTSPGIDYLVPIGTPIVPSANAFLNKVGHGGRGGLEVWLRHKGVRRYTTGYAHLSKNIIDKSYHAKSSMQRLIKRNEIIALSGASGTPEAHLHLGMFIWKNSDSKVYLDPEKHGIDGGKPVFWDGVTNLDILSFRRVEELEKVIKKLKKELEMWPKGGHELDELKGSISEIGKYLSSLNWEKILESRHFHDLRKLLKQRILVEKKCLPGSRPYSLMCNRSRAIIALI